MIFLEEKLNETIDCIQEEIGMLSEVVLLTKGELDSNINLLERLKLNNENLKINVASKLFLDDYVERTLRMKKFKVLGEEKYLFIELNKNSSPATSRRKIEMLQKEGYKVVLSNVEDYKNYSINELGSLKEQGVLLQMGMKELLAPTFKTKFLIRMNYVDFIENNLNSPEELEVVKEFLGDKKYKRLKESNLKELLYEKDETSDQITEIASGLKGVFTNYLKTFRNS